MLEVKLAGFTTEIIAVFAKHLSAQMTRRHLTVAAEPSPVYKYRMKVKLAMIF